jgi:hypothetical protein
MRRARNASSHVKSDYEQRREANIARNQAMLEALGIQSRPPPPVAPMERRRRRRRQPSRDRQVPVRMSTRWRAQQPQRASTAADALTDERQGAAGTEVREDGGGAALASETVSSLRAMCAPRGIARSGPKAALIARLLEPPQAYRSQGRQGDEGRERGAGRVRRPPPAPPSESVLNGAYFVRTFVGEHVPEDWPLEEKRMFGFAMFMVRGNMFMGFGMSPTWGEQLLVRVGENAVTAALAGQPAGVRRCMTSNGRTFSGTLMIDAEQYGSNHKMRRWFDLAMAYNCTMEAKDSSEKPRKKAKVKS